MQNVLNDLSEESTKIGSTVNISTQLDIEKIVKIIYSAFLFILPLAYFPFFGDGVTLFRSFLFISVSLVSLILIFVNAYIKKQISVLPLKYYVPFFIFILSIVLSTLFSINQSVSLYGSFNKYYSSVFFAISLVLTSIVFTTFKINLIKLLHPLVFSLFFLFSFYLLIYYKVGVFNNIQITNLPLLGSTFHLYGLSAFGAFYSYLYILFKKSNFLTKLFYFLTTLLCVYVTAVSLDYLVISLTLAFMIISFFFVFYKRSIKSNLYLSAALILITIITFLLVVFPFTQQMLVMQKQSSPRLGFTDSWLMASGNARVYPLFGSGIGTFFTTNSIYRPTTLNNSINWNLKFIEPYNFIFESLSTTGIFGLVALCYLFFVFIKYIFIYSKDLFFTFNFLFLLIILLSTNNYLVLMPLIFILFGYSLSYFFENKKIKINFPSGFIVLATFFTFIIGIYFFNFYKVSLAQYNFYRASISASLPARYNSLVSAIANDPKESVYRRELIITNLLVAKSASSKKDLSDDEIKELSDLISQAISNARFLTEREPYNSLNYEYLGLIYKSIIPISQNAAPAALDAYLKAVMLDPSNPALYMEIGSLYYSQKDYINAINYFSQSVKLKSDYTNARYNLAFALKDYRAYDEAINELKNVKNLVANNSVLVDQVDKDIELFKEEKQKNSPSKSDNNVTTTPVELEKDTNTSNINIDNKEINIKEEDLIVATPSLTPKAKPSVTVKPPIKQPTPTPSPTVREEN